MSTNNAFGLFFGVLAGGLLVQALYAMTILEHSRWEVVRRFLVALVALALAIGNLSR